MANNKSLKRATEIKDFFVSSLLGKFGESIEAIILVGSLSNGSYIPGPGRDIDLITILKENTSESIFKQVLEHIRVVEEKFDNDILISRTVYWLDELVRPFKKDFVLNFDNKRLIEAVIELQRIHESGIVLYGESDIKDRLSVPSREEVILFDKLSREWSEKVRKDNPEGVRPMDSLPDRIIIQSILTRAMKHYYYATGKTCSNKHTIAAHMKQDVAGYKYQKILDLASRYKINPDIQMTSAESHILREGCKDMKEWMERHKVDIVPIK